MSATKIAKYTGSFKYAGSLMCLVALTACATGKRDSFTVGSVPDDYKTNHPIVLSEKERTLDIPVSSGAQKLNYEALSNVKSFTSQYVRSGTGVIIVMLPSGSANAAAAGRVHHQVINAIEASGSHRGNISIQHYDASQHENAAPIRLSYRAVTASTGQCGHWNENLVDNPENRHYADFGCSSQNNLAAQIENPGDLLGPRLETQIDAENRAVTISEYRESGNSIIE